MSLHASSDQYAERTGCAFSRWNRCIQVFDEVVEISGGPAVSADQVNDTQFHTDRGVEVLHEGRRIVVRDPFGDTNTRHLLKLRNGFPIFANDRVTPVFALYSAAHVRVGIVLRMPDFGIVVCFEKPSAGGEFYFHVSGETGTA